MSMLSGRALPRAKSGDLDTALKLLLMFGNDAVVTARVTELRDATAANEVAQQKSEEATTAAANREASARAAEEDASRRLAVLGTETAESDRRLSAERGELAAERRRLGEWASNSEVQQAELDGREAALHRAFEAYA